MKHQLKHTTLTASCIAVIAVAELKAMKHQLKLSYRAGRPATNFVAELKAMKHQLKPE